MKLVMLTTDYFIWSLVLVGFLGLVRLAFNPHACHTAMQLFTRPLNVIAMGFLVTYITLGLLDSIHFRDNAPASPSYNEVISVLDKVLTPIRVNTETTYSAPFALYSFTKENWETVAGKKVRDYPRLEYAGQHLKDPSEKTKDILQKLAWASAVALIFWGAIVAILSIIIKPKSMHLPWLCGMGTLAFIIWSIITIYTFMPYYHILGTSQVGEDVLYQGLKSIRTGLVLGTVTTFVMLPFALILGLMAGYFKGWIDDAIQYLYTTLSSIPGVLLIAAAVLSLNAMLNQHQTWFTTVAERADIRLLALCFILGITSWTGLCRLLRGEALKLSAIDYVAAAKTMGVSAPGILWRHLLPNVMHIVLIAIALDFSGLVLAEAVLSYVGVGVDPTTYSWGMMINSARLEMAREPMVWWSLLTAFGMMFILVLSANIFADYLRDILDPRMQLNNV